MAALNPSEPLCLCGIRGCGLADLHAAAFVIPTARRKGGRLFSRTKRRKQRT